MTTSDLSTRVECHAGHRAEEEPRAFTIGERRMEVVEILDRWLSPAYRYFKVCADDAGTYILRHDTAADCWELTMFERGPPESQR
jgi:hypothetical protein